MEDTTMLRVRFLDNSEQIVPVKNIRQVGEKGARSGTALYHDKEHPVYNRVEDGDLWYEQVAENQDYTHEGK